MIDPSFYTGPPVGLPSESPGRTGHRILAAYGFVKELSSVCPSWPVTCTVWADPSRRQRIHDHNLYVATIPRRELFATLENTTVSEPVVTVTFHTTMGGGSEATGRLPSIYYLEPTVVTPYVGDYIPPW